MRVKGLVWLGIPAVDYAAAVRFFGQTLGLEVAFDEGNTVELAAGNGDRIQLFGPGQGYFGFCRRPAPASSRCWKWTTWIRRPPSWPAELLGEPESDGTWTWLTFRAPDGNIHSLGARMA